ncbi:MAG TPA: hypothetical protein VNL72_01275 [Gammaproteobacteria bacterium]|nr:hypothetical protein [Gammaproteobacteria bacterium]
MKLKTILCAAACLLLPQTVPAAGTGITVKAGTLGLGLELQQALTKRFALRVGLNDYTYEYDTTKDDVNYSFDFNLESKALMLDWHPFAGTFRLTAGMYRNDNALNGQAEAASSYQIGNRTYTPSEIGTLYSDITFDDTATYFGLGWGISPDSDGGFGIAVDLGLLKQGTPTVDLRAEGGTLVSDPQFQSDIQQEEQNLQEDLEEFDVYPVVSLGLSYRF